MSGRRRTRGFALLAAMWMLVVAGAIAAEFYATTRGDRRITANVRAYARAVWAARAGRAHVLAELDRRIAGGGGIVELAARDTVVPPIEIRPGPVRVRAFALDARARVHPLRSDPRVLRRLFAALELPGREADRLLARLLRWRARHTAAPRPRSDRAAGPAGRPGVDRPPEPFTTAARFAAAIGAASGPFMRVVPYLTMIGDGRINVNAAPQPVLRALPWIDAAAAAAIVRRRRRAPYANVYELIASLPRATRRRVQTAADPLSLRVAFTPRWVEIVARVRTDASIAFELRRGAEVSGNARRLLPGEVERLGR